MMIIAVKVSHGVLIYRSFSTIYAIIGLLDYRLVKFFELLNNFEVDVKCWRDEKEEGQNSKVKPEF